MARLCPPDLPDGPLRDLMTELHMLHARAGWPSSRQIARGLAVSHTTVHGLLTKTTTTPTYTVLQSVVERLAVLGRRVDVEATMDRFDRLWSETYPVPSSVD